MKKIVTYLIGLLAIACSLSASAQELTGKAASDRVPGASRIVLGENNTPKFINFEKGQGPSVAEFGAWFRRNFGYSSSYGLSPIGLEKDALGFEHLRFLQTFNGYPINHSMLVLHARGSEVVSFNGEMAPVQISPSQQKISFSQSLDAAQKFVGASVYKWEIPSQEDFIRHEQHDEKATFFPAQELFWTKGKAKGGALELAYRLNIYAHEPMSRQYVFVSAASGEVLSTENLIHHADVNGTAVTAFSGTQTIKTDYTGTTYRLRETSRGAGIETYNLQKTTTYTNTDFTDDDNVWNNVNANLDQYATDAHLGTQKTYDFYWSKFNRNSIDNLGFKLISYVHYSTNYVNAFWDGTRMTYGDGNATYKPLTSMDIAGHEVTHGLTSKTANLVYSYESGAMNEGFSDIFGTAIEFYTGVNADWLIGEDIGAAFRSMSNPNAYSQPDTYLGTMWYTGTGDNGGVHYNSGVLNYWFYLLSVGGSGTNDKGNAFNVTGIGIDKAAAISYRMLTVYLTSNSQYADARTAAIQSANDLYGNCSAESIQTTNAMYAVGIGTAGAGAPAVTAGGSLNFCSGGSVLLSASSGPSSYQWNLNGSPIAGATGQTYSATASGNYTVTGTTCGSTATSSATTVAVSTATASISPSGTVNKCDGSGVTLTATTSPGYSIQWNKDGSPISGANAATYSAQTSGNYTVTISGTTVPASTFSNASVVSINDNSCTEATSPITVSGLGTSIPTSGITIKVNITHTWDGDLKFFLEAPNGDLLALANANGSSGDNFVNTVFSDAATTNISAGTAPFTGTYKPIGANFTVCSVTTTKTTFGAIGNGSINPNGVWKLRVFDQGAQDLGTINNWEINFPSYSSPSPNCGPVTSAATAVSISNFNTPSISASGSTTFCEGNSVVLTSSATTGNLWSNGATSQSITVTEAGSYSVTASSGSCSATSLPASVSVNPAPSVFTVSGGGTYCTVPGTGSTVSLSGSETGVSYDFRFTATGSAAIVAGTGSQISTPVTGTGTVYVVATFTGSACSRNMNGSASVIPQAASSWFADADADGFGNAAVSIQACSQPQGYVSNSTDCDDASSGQNPGASEICGNGIDDNCNGTIDENCSSFVWYQDSDNDGYGNPDQSTSTAENSAPAGYVSNNSDCNDGDASVNPGASEVCNGIDDNCDGIIDNGTPGLPATGNMTGPGFVCKSSTGNVYSIDPVVGATSYQWTLPSGATGSSTTNSITISFSSTFAGGSICVTPKNNCVNGTQRCLVPGVVTAKPAQPGTISGTTAGACSTVTRAYSVVPVSGASNYVWTSPANSTVISGQGSNSIVLQFAAGFTTGTLSVTANNCLGASTARTLALSNVTAVPASITGPLTAVCAGSQQTYSTAAIAGASVYTWTVPTGASIISGQGTNSIVASFPAGFASGAITVKSGTSCYTSAARSITVYSKPSTPASLTGTSVGVCGGSTFTYSCPASTTGATFYTWTIPTGATINSGQGTTSVSVTFPAGFLSGNVAVTASNSCGTSAARSLTVRSTTAQPGTISGTSTNLCAGGSYTYTIAAVTGASSYAWTVPAGCSITASSGTSMTMSIPSGFTSGTLSVVAVNACGNSTARTLALSGIPSAPASITGPASVCPSAAGLAFSTPAVTGVSNYIWTVPTGASITSGAGTNAITVNWGTVAGSVTVKAGNACGTNATARSLAVTLAACRSAVAEEEISTPSVRIYPNPGHGQFHLDASGIAEGSTLKVSDLLGKEVLKKNIQEGENLINLDGVPAGAYFFQFQGQNLNKIIKVIRQ